MRIMIITALVLLPACAAQNCPPPKIQTQVIKEAIPAACIDPAIVPQEPGLVQLPLDARLAADMAASQALALRKWGRSLMAIIGPCER